MIHTSRAVPDTIGAVICWRCGHPAWVHCVDEPCAECERRSLPNVCVTFVIAGLEQVNTHDFEEHFLGY